jgi:hypothetical protein
MLISNDNGSPQSWPEGHEGYDDNGKGIIKKEAPTEADVNKFEEEQAIWNGHNNRAKALIMHKCEEAPRILIEDVTKASEQWSKLQKLYQNGGFMNKYLSVQELMSTSLNSCGNSVDSYLFTIQGKAKDLEKMNAKLPD